MVFKTQPKAVALATGIYTQTANGKNRVSHVVYILGTDGLVYKNTKDGWSTVDETRAMSNDRDKEAF